MRTTRRWQGLLFRYHCEPREGAFGICGFSGVEYLALGGGTLKEAYQHFDSLLAFGNDLGLFAEEIDPTRGIGQFPPVRLPVHPVHKMRKLVLLGRQGGNSGQGGNQRITCIHAYLCLC